MHSTQTLPSSKLRHAFLCFIHRKHYGISSQLASSRHRWYSSFYIWKPRRVSCLLLSFQHHSNSARDGVFFVHSPPTQGLLLYCQLNITVIMQHVSFTSTPPLDNFILPAQKRRKGMTTLYFSCVVSVNIHPFYSPSFHHTTQKHCSVSKTQNRNNKYYHRTVLSTFTSNHKEKCYAVGPHPVD